jgi:hypothetical protein
VSRPANGRWELTRGFDDFIPSAPFNPHAMSQSNPRHLTLEDDSVARHRRPEHVFNPATGELRIDLWFNNPEKDDIKQFIRQVMRDARHGLRKTVVIVAAETFASVDAYHFFSRNKFERRLGGEPAGYIMLEKRMEESRG